ncbi:MAG TPA: four-helix bundle copper-binding protein [Asanoa sp.]|nr:four-helix bundle copper-binding protein [Asanoa sp.]
MSTTLPMLETYPNPIELDRGKLAATIDTLDDCAEACTACAEACLGEPDVAELTMCIRTNLDCADVCASAARVLTRWTGYDASIGRAMLEACATACAVCAAECERHAAKHEHCRICAEACRRCEQSCRALLTEMS